jgi:carbohydrate kinase (thermoresistant glucokinase family)
VPSSAPPSTGGDSEPAAKTRLIAAKQPDARRYGLPAVAECPYLTPMPAVPGLRSPYARVARLVYFGRMLDKIRLHSTGALPADYIANLGDAKPTVFDGRICRFLRITFADLTARTLVGGTDAELLAWAENHAGLPPRTDEECEIWNAFITKRGWRDLATPLVRQRAAESGLAERPIETMFDYIDFDEGRDPVATRAWELKPAVLLVMGVSGSGKSTTGRALADALGWAFADADDLHPRANVAKMSAGHPLTDSDRAPWLDSVRDRIAAALAADAPCVVACSALKQAYRDHLFVNRQRMRLVYLRGPRALLAARLAARAGHFMPPGLLDSQLAGLEEPADALVADIAAPPADIVASLRAGLGL